MQTFVNVRRQMRSCSGDLPLQDGQDDKGYRSCSIKVALKSSMNGLNDLPSI